ncbi:putative monooxygenase [Cladobotryum mycophilum]|uniref:Monooxygenase n=1 Tax=Cladobotryum mycophilum TaxID=491253 RepID=A0ABR0SD98_9HYPO
MAQRSELASPFFHPFIFLYQIIQWRPRIAVIGAGITGVSAAAHIIGHGFDVTIFESRGKANLGGIWSRVNDTSGLQIHSLMYRFHPSIKWERGYPDRKQIITQIKELWKRYGLEQKTIFDCKVSKVRQDDQTRWIINGDPSHGLFDGLIVAVGTCGEPKKPHIPGMDKFKGSIYHSSELTGKDAKGKKIAIIGGGASAVEALEFASAADAAKISILSRSDKWIIPRNFFVDTLLSFNVFGQETFLSFIPEFFLRKFFYRDLEDLAPTGDKGLFMGTPMVNSDVMDKLRQGKAEWIRGDIEGFKSSGVIMNRRARGVPKGGPGHEEVVKADIVIMATGFKRPSLSLLPDDCFKDPYGPPNWYLQTFPPTHPSVSAINSTYLEAIGTVGNWHVGIYTRILLMFIIDPLTRPSQVWMKRWIDMTRILKKFSPTGAFDFFTYLELVWWFAFCVAFNPFRWKWALFVFFGIGLNIPQAFVTQEKKFINGEGYKRTDEGTSF